MKNFKLIVLTAMGTIILGAGFTGKALLDEGIVTIEKRSTTHSERHYIDDKLVKERNWDELCGYTVKINVVDEAYFGK